MSLLDKIIPMERTAANAGTSAKLKAESRHEAIHLFKDTKKRLLDINHWNQLSGPGSAEFRLTDEEGNLLISSEPKIGDLIRISYSNPTKPSEQHHEWVRIEEFEHSRELLKDEELFGFKVRPIKKPVENSTEKISYLAEYPTSTFFIMRKLDTIMAMEIGRSENSQIKSDSVLNKLRNFIVELPSILGFAKSQWKSLMTGILNPAA